MRWELSSDVQAYAEHALELLESDPARNTVALTVLAQLRAGHAYSDLPPSFAWCEDDGKVVGAAFMTPPYDLALAVVPLDAIDSLAACLAAAGVVVPSVLGDPEVCAAFVERWPAAPPRREMIEGRQRLYILDRLVPPEPLPIGAARIAAMGDIDMLVRWTHAFHLEAGTRATDRDAGIVQRRVEASLIWVWEADGALVSMASRNVTAAGVARIGPVYTPPEHRSHGYGAAVTAACTADALARDAEEAVLFTDLANPTSNKIYQTIGYRPVTDRVRYAFTGDM